MSNGIRNYNSKGEYHGYQERYWGGKLFFKCFYYNDTRIDYEEYYCYSGKLWFKDFHI